MCIFWRLALLPFMYALEMLSDVMLVESGPVTNQIWA